MESICYVLSHYHTFQRSKYLWFINAVTNSRTKECLAKWWQIYMSRRRQFTFHHHLVFHVATSHPYLKLNPTTSLFFFFYKNTMEIAFRVTVIGYTLMWLTLNLKYGNWFVYEKILQRLCVLHHHFRPTIYILIRKYFIGIIIWFGDAAR